MAIIQLTDDVLLEAYNLTPSAKELAAQFQMAESSIHYRLSKLRARGLIPAVAQPNQYTSQTTATEVKIATKQTPAKPATVIRDLMTNRVFPADKDPLQMIWGDTIEEEIQPAVKTLAELKKERAQKEQPKSEPIVEHIPVHTQPTTDWATKIAMLIPKKRPYIERGEDTLFENAMNEGFNVILQGEAGTGKTRMVQYHAEKNNLPFLRVSCDDSSQLRQVLGTMQASNGTTWFKEGIMLELIKQPCVILFDEFNCLPSSRLFFLHEILDNRRVHISELDQSFEVHPGCRIALACNPNTARYSGTNKVNAALADRCTTIIMPDLSEEFIKQFIQADDRRKFFIEINKSMKHDQVRASFSLRGATRIEQLIKSGTTTIKNAYKICFLNNVALTASQEQAEQIEQTARVIVKGWENN